MSIRELAAAIPVTHSAASQTVAQMKRSELVELRTGTDARERIVHLTEKCLALLPLIQAEWTATELAGDALDAELPMPLRTLLTAVLDAVTRLSMHDRIVAAARTLDDPALQLPPGGNE
jgi:DNA-binding MarR family transcriptional regulator